MNEFEQILDTASELTGWDTDTKYALVLNFLYHHCPEKINTFRAKIDGIVADEIGN